MSFFFLFCWVRFAPSFLLSSLFVRDSLLLLAVLKLVVSGSLFDGYLMEIFFLLLNHLFVRFRYLMRCIFIVGFLGVFMLKVLFSVLSNR